MAKFVEQTFRLNQDKPRKRQSKKSKGKNNELRLKKVTPQEEVVRKNLESIIKQNELRRVKENVIEAITKSK